MKADVLFPVRNAVSENYYRPTSRYSSSCWSSVAPAPLPPRDVVLSRVVPLLGGSFGVEHERVSLPPPRAQTDPLPFRPPISPTSQSRLLTSVSAPASYASLANLAPALTPPRAPVVVSPEQKHLMTSTLAYCIYEERLSSSVAGDANADWYMAENFLNDGLRGRPVGDISLPQSFRALAFIHMRSCLRGLLEGVADRR